MIDALLQAAPGVISGISLAVVAWIARQLSKLAKRFGALEKSQRNQLKAQIVAVYECSKERGYITPMELETVNRRADSYFDLGGNHYIHAVMKRLNEDMEIKGEEIPE